MEEELIKLLLANPTAAVAKIKTVSKDNAKIVNYRKEYFDHDRDQRDLQLNKIQKDKTVGTGEKSKLVRAVKIPINFAKKIVTTSTGFEIGKPVTLKPSDTKSTLGKIVKELWRSNRLDSMLVKLVEMKKRETQSAIQFFISDMEESSRFNKFLVLIKLKAQKKEIKAKLLDNTSGIMTPVFDASGNMILFMWQYETKSSDDKAINNVEVWDKKLKYSCSDASGTMKVDSKLAHGFDRIPMVYVSQDEPEWFVVKEMIDRLEVALSKLGASNDYTSHPLLKIFGEVTTFPDKDDSGKVLNFPIKPDPADPTKFLPHGDADFVTADNAVESQKLEIDTLINFIHYISSTPNISFDNLKGLGAMSGVAIKLMFMDAMLKATLNESDNRTMIERMLNIIISGVINVTNVNLKAESTTLFFDVQFNSILPSDLKEAVDIAANAVTGKVMARKTAVKFLDMNEDIEQELADIKYESETIEPKPAVE